MILFNNIISNAMRIRNLIFIVFFICGSNFSFANTSVPFLIKSNSFNLVRKDSVVRLQNTQSSSSLKHILNKNKKNNNNVFLSIFEIEEEDSFSCSVKVLKIFQYSSLDSINSCIINENTHKRLFPFKNLFSFKKSKLFIDHQSFLI